MYLDQGPIIICGVALILVLMFILRHFLSWLCSNNVILDRLSNIEDLLLNLPKRINNA